MNVKRYRKAIAAAAAAAVVLVAAAADGSISPAEVVQIVGAATGVYGVWRLPNAKP